MKTILATLLVLFLSLPTVSMAGCPEGSFVIGNRIFCSTPEPTSEYEVVGDADGNALSCVRDTLVDSPRNYTFKDARVYESHVSVKIPPSIYKIPSSGHYISTVDYIEWNSLEELFLTREYSHRLNRQTLKMVRTLIPISENELNDPFAQEHYTCLLKTPEEINTMMNNELEKLKERMKDNKL